MLVNKETFNAIAFAAAGFVIGAIVKGLVDQKTLEHIKKERNYWRKEYNAAVDKLNEKIVALYDCRHLNYQVAGYAMTLQKQIDDMMS